MNEILEHKPYRPLVYLSCITVGLLLIVLGGLTLIEGSTNATKTLVHRGDCRSIHQGDYFTALSELVVEATEPQPSVQHLEHIAKELKIDAKLYKGCAKLAIGAPVPTLPAPATTLTTSAP